MKITDIFLGDFGIFQNSSLSDLSEGLVIIGGRNRAGKSTFREALKYLGYGFPQKKDFPPATDKYHLTADLLLPPEQAGTESSVKANLKLRGYANPVLNIKNNREGIDKDLTVKDLYNQLDFFTYQQLFTISLAELQKTPPGVSGEEESRLQSLLLGGGLNQIVNLPAIAESYNRKAKNIGGKLGRSNVSQFKSYDQRIKKAEEEKDKALQQIDKYQQLLEELEDLEADQEKNREEIAELQKKLTRLDILANNHFKYLEYRQLKQKIINHPGQELKQENYSPKLLNQGEHFASQYQKITTRITEEKKKLNEQLPLSRLAAVDRVSTLLLAEEENILAISAGISGVEERLKNLIEAKKRHQEEKEELKVDAAELRADFAADLESLAEIRADSIARQELLQTIEEYKKLIKEQQEINSKIAALKEQQQQLNQKEELLAQKPATLKSTWQKSLVSTAGLIGLAALAGYFDFLWGIFLAAGGLVISLPYYFHQYQLAREREKDKEELNTEKKLLEEQIDQQNKSLSELNEALMPLEEKLDNYRQLLGIEEAAAPDLIASYFTSLQELKRRYQKLKATSARLQAREQEVLSDLSNVREILHRLNKKAPEKLFPLPEKEALLSEQEKLFSAWSELQQYLTRAQRIGQAVEEKESLLSDIRATFSNNGLDDDFLDSEVAEFLQQYQEEAKQVLEFKSLQKELKQLTREFKETLNSTDRIRQAFTALDKSFALDKSGEESESPAEAVSLLKNYYDKFGSQQEIEATKKRHQQKLEELQQKSQDITAAIQKKQQQKETLASSDKIMAAHEEIDQARAELRQLAEDYALNRTVAFILEKVRERTIKRAKEELLEPASELLSRITAGEYQEIEPARDFTDPDFATSLADGQRQSSTALLSRGTREQLFWAVRINRIRSIKPPLPVIIDDSLTNFDHPHLYRAAEVITELAADWQVFFLTCHPYVVDYLAQKANLPADKLQYWQLKEGNFSQSSASELINYLAV